MHQLAGRHPQARCLEACLRDAGTFSQWCSPAPVQRCHHPRRQRSPHKLHVSCPAVEQDTEVPSTSGRPHSDSDLIQSLLAQDQVLDVLEDQQQLAEQPDIQRDLLKRIKLSGSLSLLCELVQAEAHHFDHKVTSAALYRLSILCHAYFTQLQSAQLTSQEAQQAAWVKYVDPALKTLGQLLLQHMDACDTFTVSISLWAYGHLQCGEEAVLAALSIRGMQLLHDFNTIDCAAALVGLAKHTGPRTRSQREFVEQLMHHTHALISHVEAWAPRDIISVVWALSHLGAAGPARRPLLQGLVEMSLWRIEEFGVRELVITVYSLGRLRMRLPPQMVKLTNQIMRHLDQLNPQDAANLVYACAKVQFKQPELLQKLPDVVLPQLNRFKPQEIGNLVYGYGQLHFQHPLLLDAVASTCGQRLAEFTTQDLCMTVWAYGAVGYCPSDTALFESACRVLLQRKERLLPLQITCVIKGFSRAGYQPPAAFMQQMSALAQVKLCQFSPLEYSQLLWAYSVAGYRDVALFEAVVAHAIQQLHSKSHPVTKTTVDTMLVACQGVGFWPQLLVDTAEINGLYVRTQKQLEDAGGAAAAGDGGSLQPLSVLGPELASDVAAAAAAADAAAAAAAACGVGGEAAPVQQRPVPQPQPEVFFSQAQLQQERLVQQQQQQQQQQEWRQQQQQPAAMQSQAHCLQRPQLPPQQQQQAAGQHLQQQDGQPEQQQQQQQASRQQQQQGSLDHPLVRSHLLPPPLLPKQPPRSLSPLPAAAIELTLHSNGTGSSSSSNQQQQQQGSQRGSGSSAQGMPHLPEQLAVDALVLPVEPQSL